MKRIILLGMFFLIFTSFVSLNARWAKVYEFMVRNSADSIRQTNDGGYIVAGTSGSGGNINRALIWILKLTTYGEIEWQREYQISYMYELEARSIEQTNDGGYIIAAYYHPDYFRTIILKLSSTGDIEWHRTFGGLEKIVPDCIKQTSDGGYIVAGNTSSFGAGGDDILVFKLSSTGDIEWQKTYGGSKYEQVYSIQQTDDGGYIVAGNTSSFGAGGDDILVFKLSSTGNVEWQNTYGGSSDDIARAIQQTSDGGYIVAGYTRSFGAGEFDIWILKLGLTGDLHWGWTYGGSMVDRAYSVQETDDRGYIIAGTTQSFGVGGGDDIWVFKLYRNGLVEWQNTYGGSSDDIARAIQQTSDGGYIIAGTTQYFATGDSSYIVLKISSNGDIDPSCGDFIQESNAIYSLTNINPEASNITPQDTNISPPLDVEISPPVDTNADAILICGFEPPYTIINVVTPIEGALVGNNLDIVVTTESSYEIKNVLARVEDRETYLVFSERWEGTISLAGLTRGEKLLTVTAIDVFNNMAEVQRSFIYDQNPSLTIKEPRNYSVARPLLRFVATCTDDDPAGCSSIRAGIYDHWLGIYPVLATGQNSIDETVSLADYEGHIVYLRFEAMDSAGQVSSENRKVYVESSIRLKDVESVGGNIWDVHTDRILFLEASGDANILKIRDRASGQESIVMDESGKIPSYGFLAPKGAIFVVPEEAYPYSSVYEWRDGALIELSGANSTSSLKVKGDYAIWNKNLGGYGNGLILRNLVTGENTTVATNAGNWNNDVASNGDVAYWTSPLNYNIFRFRNGVTTKLTHDSDLMNTYPLTDGINVVYRKHPGSFTDHQIAMYEESGEVILEPNRSEEPWPGRDYQVNNGWVAFTKLGTGGQLQVWVRSPSGESSQISYFGTSSYINALGPNGEVTFINDVENGLYLGSPSFSLIQIGSCLSRSSRSFYQNGQWFVIIGRSLFRIDTTSQPSISEKEDSGKKRGCFIATAAYNSPKHPHIKILRDFRAKYLMRNKFGQKLVGLYYIYSPYVAKLITKHKALKVVVRSSILPFVVFSYYMLHFGPIITAVMHVFIFVLPVLLISFFRRRLRQVEAKSHKALASLD